MPRRSSPFFSALFLLICALVSCSVAHKHEHKHAQDNDAWLNAGVWYGGGAVRAPATSRSPRAEIAQWQADVKQIHDLGFNSIKTWIDWATAERRQGQFDFTALQQLLSLVANETKTSGQMMRALVQIYADSAPDWVVKQYPDAAFVGSNGREIKSQGAPGACFDHPEVRQKMLNFMQQVAAVAAQSGDTLHAIDLWSEPHVVNWIWSNDPSMQPNVVQFCYCKHSQARFRTWLAKKYGSLDALNEAWYRSFQSWEEVEAPRYGTITTYSDWTDWSNFTFTKIAEDLQARARAVNSVAPNAYLTSHSAAVSISSGPTDDYGVPDDWRMTQHLRAVTNKAFYGASFYPLHAMAPLGGRGPVELGFMFTGAYSASADQGFFVGELQAGQGITGTRTNVAVTAEHHRDWYWNALSKGAKSIHQFAYYPMSSGYESGGYGLLNLDGTPTDRAKESGRIASIVNKWQSVLYQAKPEPASIGILYNVWTALAGGNTIGSSNSLRNSMLGVYKSLYSSMKPIKFIHVEELTRSDTLRSTQVLYLPYPIVMPQGTCEALKRFVADGGTLISEARLAWLDQYGMSGNGIIPGCGLSEVFQVRESIVKPVDDKAAQPSHFTFGKSAPAELQGLQVPSIMLEENVQLLSKEATSWASFDSDAGAALTVSSYGGGRTAYAGSFLSLAANTGNENAQKVIRYLVNDFGRAQGTVASITTEEACKSTSNEARLMTTQHQGSPALLLFVFNRSKSSCKFQVALKGLNVAKGVDLAHNEQPVNVMSDKDGVQVDLMLSAQDTAVILMLP